MQINRGFIWEVIFFYSLRHIFFFSFFIPEFISFLRKPALSRLFHLRASLPVCLPVGTYSPASILSTTDCLLFRVNKS